MPFLVIGIIVFISFIILIIFIAVIIFILSGSGSEEEHTNKTDRSNKTNLWDWYFTPEYKRAGISGEISAACTIQSVLQEGDRLLTNVKIEYDGKDTELDNVVVNKYGVFIIEVKNYAGYIVGNEDEYEWKKYKTTKAGNTYEKAVKNPIKQVKRQIYLLANYLRYYGCGVWVKGYAMMIQGNSPVESEYMLNNVADIDKAIHKADRRMLNKKTVEDIINLLS